MNEHTRLQDDWLVVCRKHSFLLDHAEGRRHGWVQSVDLHDDCVEVRHVRVDGLEVELIYSIDLGEERGQELWILLQLDQCPQDV